jgi:geranylgeranyl pyrophosphate synthase
MNHDGVPTVGLDQADAAELAELCAHLAGWLSHAPDAVGASLEGYAGQAGWRFELRDDLLRWARRLETLEPRP